MLIKYWIKYALLYCFFVFKYRNVQFKIINDRQELNRAYILIERVYAMERNYAAGGQRLRDEFDENSIKIGAFRGWEVIGFARIIMPSDRGLYVEKDFNIEIPEFAKASTAELSRFMVADSHRDQLLSFVLFKKVLEICNKNRINNLILVTPKNIYKHVVAYKLIDCYPLKQLKLTKKHIEARKKMINYYRKNNPAPYIIPLKQFFKL